MSRDLYSLRQMVDMTGVSEFTLRGWESRYEAFSPERTETGRRRYTAKDLQKAILLRELVQREHRIGDIARLSMAELRDLMEPGAAEVLSVDKATAGEIQTILKFAALQEWSRLDSAIRAGVRKKSPLAAAQDFIVPLLEAMGHEVAENRLGIAQEHVLSALLKQTMHRLIAPGSNSPGPRFVVATPEGDFHEMGILVAHVIASQLKINSLYLGPNTPKRELCETVSRWPATHLLIGSTVTKKEGAKEDFYGYVHYLDQNLPKQVAFWFGGRGCQPLELSRETRSFSSILEFREELKKFRKAGKKRD